MKLLIIPDGNRRWAEKNKVSFDEGYRRMAEKLGMAVDYLAGQGIGELWVVCNTIMHRQRPEEQVALFWNHFLNIAGHVKSPGNLKVVVTENTDLFFADYRERFEGLQKRTSGNRGFMLNYFINFSGEEPMPEMDVVWKTGAAGNRNYLCGVRPSYFTKIHFSDKLWPDIEIEDLKKIIAAYSK